MKTTFAMGTFLTVQIKGKDSSPMEHLFIEEVRRLEKLLSLYRPSSEISGLNEAAGTKPLPVSNETYAVIREALRYAQLSGGAFDPTLQPQGYRHVTLDPELHTVFISRPDLQLDLGGIGKGFALDRALTKILQVGEVEWVSADFGGQLLFWHQNGSFDPETILIDDPAARSDQGDRFSFQITSNGSVSTSSHAQQPGHLWDPLQGKPATVLTGVTVAAPNATQAEALSTAVFVMGQSEGKSWLTQFSGVQAFIFPHESQN